MAQTFEYPNMLSGTRTGKGWTREGGIGGNGFDAGTGLELCNKKADECFLASPDVVLHTRRTYSLSFYAASTANMSSCDIFVLDNGGYGDAYQWIGATKSSIKPPAGGAWTTWTFTLSPQARDGATFRVRFDNNGTTDGKQCLVWFRDIMLCESDVPRAWAPGPDDDWS